MWSIVAEMNKSSQMIGNGVRRTIAPTDPTTDIMYQCT